MSSPARTRAVRSSVEMDIREEAELVWSVAVADGAGRSDEQLSLTVDGSPVAVREVAVADGGRLHVCTAPVGRLRLDYRATVTSSAAPAEVDPVDDIVYRRPSRYAESDELGPTAWAEFRDLEGKELLDAVSSWVGTQLYYVSGSSRPTDGATQTFLARQGVCRDFAHLVIAMLRARNVPARLVSVYAPGLDPMDFHAVVEAAIDGRWYAVDATTLAPRGTLVRIATGRDASDTAFLTVQSGRADLVSMSVDATASPDLPGDDLTSLVALG
ncbi:Transglutaminase-like enzyme, putative cysteine protease [Nocardioides scoriae]|uniref:Transglutaminase-like enzyme, putative cysteine protease n=1 Tax=Nocardioides scoriae TaxID=642780 RepID=A0A1H1VT78_9ACTN|nr:transglutaminase family protein [Nocardioides scoriae]SDS87855.1 Transglutaminase-like enzyme, putative cysteine protease [Nocardioides scoriae]